jgi:hypothetical protein
MINNACVSPIVSSRVQNGRLLCRSLSLNMGSKPSISDEVTEEEWKKKNQDQVSLKM